MIFRVTTPRLLTSGRRSSGVGSRSSWPSEQAARALTVQFRVQFLDATGTIIREMHADAWNAAGAIELLAGLDWPAGAVDGHTRRGRRRSLFGGAVDGRSSTTLGLRPSSASRPPRRRSRQCSPLPRRLGFPRRLSSSFPTTESPARLLSRRPRSLRQFLGLNSSRNRTFPRSEYYFDFARHHERRHMIGGMAGVAEATPIGLYRGESHRPAAGPDFARNP